VDSNLKWAAQVAVRAGSRVVRLWNESFRLRTKLLLSFVLLTVGLTWATLLVVRRNARAKEEERIEEDARNAILTFEIFQRQQQETLGHKADLLASIAMMRNGDETAITEASNNPWQSDECNLFVLADKDGAVLALQSRGWSFPQAQAQEMVSRAVRRHDSSGWWFASGNLYQVVLQPFYADPAHKQGLQGFVVVGRALDYRSARDLARISSSDVVLRYGDEVAVSTLAPLKNLEFTRQSWRHNTAVRMDLDGERYYVRSFELTPGVETGPNLVILKSYRALEAYLQWLNQLLLGLGVAAIFAGGGLIFLISDNVTRPLASLMKGVQALERGDFSYALEARGQDELSRLTQAFENMRSTLQSNETQLRQAQKMEALGRLAGGVAHDFNNLLTVIRGHSELLLDKLPPTDSLHNHSQQIKRTSDRAAALTRQLLAFSRMQVLEPKVLDVNELLVEMGKLLRRLIREDIEFCLRLGESVGRVKGDPGQLEQVLLNLTVNASDAMRTGGRLTIETQNVLADEEYARKRPSVEPGRYVMISVADTGYGMDAATKGRIFEPFFTTKERGQGSGLGLATVYGVVRQSGGYIWVESELGEGTRFEVYLPSTEDRAETELGEITGKGGAARVRPKTVLIVEDEQGVRELACEFLTSAGYKVLTAEDGWEGLQVAKRLGTAIQVVLTDLIMPKIGGHELGMRLKCLLPHLKIVYMTGYLEQNDDNSALASDGFFIQKPFSRDALICKLDEALRTDRAAGPKAQTMTI